MQHPTTDLARLGWTPFFERHFEPYRSQSLIPVRIARRQRYRYQVYGASGEHEAVLTGRFRHTNQDPAAWPVVGDWVAAEPDASLLSIQACLPRTSAFARKKPGDPTVEQVVAANVDWAIWVTALDRDFNLRRIERYLTQVWDSGAQPVLVLNKADVCPDLDARVAAAEAVAVGAPVHAISAHTGAGLAALEAYVQPGRTVAVMGSSGVGKSTLINALLGTDRQRTGAVREGDGRGRHTTTDRELLLVPSGGLLVDNPGIRELGLWGDEEDVSRTFADIEALAEACRFRDCRHENEPGCAVRAALEDGTLDERRYRSYVKQRKELHYLALRQDQRAQQIQKQKWKAIHKAMRKHPRKR